MKKWLYDVILGAVILACSAAALIYSYVLEPARATYFLARPDTYMALWLGLLIFFSVLLIIRGIRQRKTEEGQAESRPIWTYLPLMTAGVLFLYLILLDKLGFLLDSSLMLWALVFLYTINSGGRSWHDGKKKVMLELLKSGVFAVLSSTVIYYVFTQVLSTKLPTFQLF